MATGAVKIIDRLKTPKDYQDKFMPRELELWPHLIHPNLVRLYDCFQVLEGRREGRGRGKGGGGGREGEGGSRREEEKRGGGGKRR